MLRVRLVLGLMCLLVILLAMGLYSIDRCSELGKRLIAVTHNHDRDGSNISQMKRSASAMTGALLSLVVDNPEQSRRDFSTADNSFRTALDEEIARADAPTPEKALLAKIHSVYSDYEDRARQFLASSGKTDPNWRAMAVRLANDSGRLLDLLDQLVVIRDREPINKFSSEDINQTVRSLALLMIIAIMVAIYASVRLTRGLLRPLVSLTQSIQQIGQGNLDQEVPVLSKDELGMLAVSFNQMALQLRAYRSTTSVELMRLNRTIRATLASFPDPIFVLNSEGAVELRNPEADQLAVKLLFSGVTRLPAKVDEKVEQVRLTGQDYLPTLFKDAIKFHLDGQDRYFLPRIVLLRDEKYETFGVAVILENVTRMLLLDDVKSNMIATVSHELKTPLTTVRMALYLLHERTVGTLNDRQSDLVATAREDADRLLRTLNDLLDLAKLEQGPPMLELEEMTPEQVLEMAVRDTRDVASEAGITLKIEAQPGLPSVQIDRQRIAYVFDNLITNAIKYSERGSSVVLSLHMGSMRDEKRAVRFAVKDRGPGIAPEHQEHVFERFYRVPGTRKSGAGLGLSIAREIVASHRGEIGVISILGQGSEFFFVLPPANRF